MISEMPMPWPRPYKAGRQGAESQIAINGVLLTNLQASKLDTTCVAPDAKSSNEIELASFRNSKPSSASFRGV
jgi:hypothetical protein